MRVRSMVLMVAAMAISSAAGTASACHTCKQTPCVQPAYQCVTEMVPYTVYKKVKKTAYNEVTETVMTKVPQTTYTERQRVVCKPVWDTQYVQREVSVCKPVTQTSMVTQQYTVCKPVTTTKQVVEYTLQPTTTYVTVPVVSKCGLCGKHQPVCGCKTVAKTCYTSVPVTRDVVCTSYISEVQTREVPVTTTTYVRETKVENVPVRTCRYVQEVVTERVPCTTWTCVPKTVVRKVPYTYCETVAVTCYKKVKTMVPVVYAAPVATEQAVPVATPQAVAPSKQG